MLFQIPALALLAFTSATIIPTNEPIPIVKQILDVGFDGNYHNFYKTGNGITVNEHGLLKNVGIKGAEASEVVGYVSYSAPDGTPIALRYIANENGYIAQGPHLPVAPAVPKAIIRALEWIASHPKDVEASKRL